MTLRMKARGLNDVLTKSYDVNVTYRRRRVRRSHQLLFLCVFDSRKVRNPIFVLP